MSESDIHSYKYFKESVLDAADEHDALYDGTTVSLPVPADAPTSSATHSRTLLTFLYVLHENEDESEQDTGETTNPIISHPYARVETSSSGEILGWMSLMPQPSGQAGRRFNDLAAMMRADEQEAFIQAYYELLTSDAGLLHEYSLKIEADVINDLRELFYAFVETPFLPLYRQHAAEFLKLIMPP
jgi:hypothetical protein